MALPEAPNSRAEQYLAKIAGQEATLPEAPNSRVEQYLDYIAANGTVSEEEIAEKVSTWLEENIHEDPTVVIDTSLSVSGAAADSKSAGDEITALKEDLSENINDLNSAITTNKTDIEIMSSFNKWCPDRTIHNATISTSTGSKGDIVSGSYNVTEMIPASKGEKFQWYCSDDPIGTVPSSMAVGTAFRIAEYRKDGSYILNTPNWPASPYTVQSDEAYYIRLAVQARNWNMVTVNDKNIAQKPFTAYKPDINLVSYLTQFINQAEVILPSCLYGVTGQEINIYKENLVLYNRLKSLTYIHTRLPNDAYQSDSRTIWNPSVNALTEADYKWEVFGVDTSRFPNYKTIKVCTIPKNTGNSSIKVLIIGDSKVENGYVSYHFLHDFDDDNMSCTLLGTKYKWSTDNRMEGYGSRTAKWFCTNIESPFCKNGAFDFANYLSVNSIDTPDFVFVNLGTNDCASLSGSNNVFITEFDSYIAEMIASIHSVDANIPVIIGMCEGVSTVKDVNNAEFMYWDLNQKISRLHKSVVETFDNRQNENIYVCPMYMGMDLTQDYTMVEVPLSKRDGDVNGGQGDGKTRMDITDRTHQNEVGSWKNADYMYALVKYITAKSLT